MSKITTEIGIELLYASLPYPEQIRELDLSSESAIYFKWRFNKYKFDLSMLSIDAVDGMMLVGNDTAILMTELIKLTYSRMLANQAAKVPTQNN